jgi:ABC-type transport system involved in multi-copper enzyme maturation permease subunit
LQESESLQRTRGAGPLSGTRNKIREENGRWWNTRKWLYQTCIWLLVMNGIPVIAILEGGSSEVAKWLPEIDGVFAGLMGWMIALGVIVLAQSDIVEEKQSGTAEWVLSAPLSRLSFILSKLVVEVFWLVMVFVVVQFIAFQYIIQAFGAPAIPLINLLQGMALQGLAVVFWLSFSLMLGTFSKTRGPVIGIPLVFLFFQQIIPMIFQKYVPSAQLYLPVRLSEYSGQMIQGLSLPSVLPIATAVAASILFTILAIMRFMREEF